MSDFFTDIAKPSWWLGVVIVGLALNVVASYVRDWIDRTGKSVSDRKRARSQRQQAEIIRQADLIRGEMDSCMFHLLRSISVRISSNTIFFLGLISWIAGLFASVVGVKILCVISGAFSFWTALKLERRGSFMEDVVYEALKAKKDNKQSDAVVHKSVEVARDA